jgi:hypothetical protein
METARTIHRSLETINAIDSVCGYRGKRLSRRGLIPELTAGDDADVER